MLLVPSYLATDLTSPVLNYCVLMAVLVSTFLPESALWSVGPDQDGGAGVPVCWSDVSGVSDQ